jgi:hypothetical protein
MVIAVWDNFMNVMDISQTVLLSVSDSHDQYSLNSDYWKGKERAKRKAAYKLYSDIIMLKLLDKPQIIITNSDLSTTDGTDLMYKDKTIAGTW